MRTIARAAGVSNTTVSMALRDHPAITEATRRKVRQVATSLGYVPDPEIAKLMQHLQRRQKPRFQSTIAALTTYPASGMPAYATALHQGAQAAARDLGYTLALAHIPPESASNARLQHVLRARGDQGILLLPMLDALPLESLVDWSQFSVVAATWGVLRPQFNRAAPDQFSNAFLICRTLAALGRQRIGLVVESRLDVIVGHRFSAAVAWQNSVAGREAVPPYVYNTPDRIALRRWFRRYRPDAIIVGSEHEARPIADSLQVPLVGGPVEFAVEDHTEPSELAGIDQRPDEVGATAVKLLHSMIQRGERGIPATPTLTMVTGRWIAGTNAGSPPSPDPVTGTTTVA